MCGCSSLESMIPGKRSKGQRSRVVKGVSQNKAESLSGYIMGHWSLHTVGLSEKKHEVCLRTVYGVAERKREHLSIGPSSFPWNANLQVHPANKCMKATQQRSPSWEAAVGAWAQRQIWSGCTCMRTCLHRAGHCHKLLVSDWTTLKDPSAIGGTTVKKEK